MSFFQFYLSLVGIFFYNFLRPPILVSYIPVILIDLFLLIPTFGDPIPGIKVVLSLVKLPKSTQRNQQYHSLGDPP